VRDWNFVEKKNQPGNQSQHDYNQEEEQDYPEHPRMRGTTVFVCGGVWHGCGGS
jgi:hypothetical protein